MINKINNTISDIAESLRLYTMNLSNTNEDTITKDIKEDLNKLFRDNDGRESTPSCKSVIITKNTDKQFFGLNVYPIFFNDDTGMANIVLDPDKDFIVNKYYLEIDSKLFNVLSNYEIALCILYDITALCTDNVPMKRVRDLVNMYLVNKREVIRPSEYAAYKDIFNFGIRDAMQKVTSMFNIGDDAVGANQFINDISSNTEFGPNLNNTLFEIRNKLKTSGMISFNEYETPIVVLSYILNLYNNMKNNKRTARKELINILPSISSQLRKREIENLIKRLDMIDDNMINEGFLGKALNSFKVSGLKGYENDYYELKFEANNVEDDDQALLLIARINSRMSVIADYLSTEEDIPTSQRVRWTKLLNDYNALRNQLASEKLRRNKTRLYVNYGFDD
jgi:hypothetical protein